MKTPAPLRLATLVLSLCALPAHAWDYPPTPRHPVTNTYQGVAVVDDYQWLENFDSPDVQEWNSAQNKLTRPFLDKLPARQPIADRLKKLYNAISPNYAGLESRPGVLFALKFKPPAQQPWIITLKSADDPSSEKVVFDPNKLDPSGATSMDWWTPSLDGKLVAICLSKNGSEQGTLFFYDVQSGQPLADQVPRVQFPTAGGSVAWNADCTGVCYTRYPAPGERPDADLHFYQQIWFHRLGTPIGQDQYELGKDFPRIAEIDLNARDDGKYVLATVANGDGGDYAVYLRGPDAQWRQVTQFSDGVKHCNFGKGGDEAIYVRSLQNAPHGKILRIPLATPDLQHAKAVVPESEAVIQEFLPVAGALYIQDLVGGPSQIRCFQLDASGEAAATPQIVPLKPVSSVQQMVSFSGSQILYRNISYIEPYVWMLFDPASGQSRPTALAGSSPADFSNVEVVREFATSKDGTHVPMNIIRRKGLRLDGKNPTLLYGYGGYGISLSPSFSLGRSIWLDHGGVYVVANLRGGGEFGEAWHKAGNLTRKQNVFDDFAACAKYLIDKKYTRRSRLAVEGASNGGLLMGAFLTQHPDLVAAVVSHVGIYDSLRTELEPNGAFNVTEFGTVTDPDQFKALYDYSPYHHVKEGTRYPAVLLLTGDHDGRVNPYNSRKMIARLQAANASSKPMLLRTTAAAGHGMGSSLDVRIAEESDVWAFLFDQLGVQYQASVP